MPSRRRPNRQPAGQGLGQGAGVVALTASHAETQENSGAERRRPIRLLKPFRLRSSAEKTALPTRLTVLPYGGLIPIRPTGFHQTLPAILVAPSGVSTGKRSCLYILHANGRRAGRRADRGLPVAEVAFPQWPAVVGIGLHAVHLFAADVAHVGHPERAVPGSESQPPRIAEAPGVRFGPRPRLACRMSRRRILPSSESSRGA